MQLCCSLIRKNHHKANMGETAKISVLKRVDNIVKSAGDNRSYRGLELSNHMKVLLVSDPTTDKSAAAMDVNIGKSNERFIMFVFSVASSLFQAISVTLTICQVWLIFVNTCSFLGHTSIHLKMTIPNS